MTRRDRHPLRGSYPWSVSLSVLGIVMLLTNGLASHLQAQPQRLALVIGNSQYTAAPLQNPINDATDMATALQSVGFKVTLRTDATQRQMRDAVETWSQTLRGSEVGLFYFAGHGVQVQSKNYLIPLGVNITRETDLEFDAMPVDWIIRKLTEGASASTLVVLDACRNNPFVRSFRSAQSGLALMKAGEGMFIAFSTEPENVAQDGSGRNSPYTKHLVHQLQRPQLKVEEVFKEVRKAVVEETGRKQIPWDSSSLTKDVYFIPPAGIVARPGSERRVDMTTAAREPSAAEGERQLAEERQRIKEERERIQRLLTEQEKLEEEKRRVEAERQRFEERQRQANLNPPQSPPPRSPIDSQEVQSFVNKLLVVAGRGDLAQLLAFYADSVDYYNAGIVGKDFIYLEQSVLEAHLLNNRGNKGGMSGQDTVMRKGR